MRPKTLRDYAAILRRRAWILVLATALAIAGAVGYAEHQRKLYNATAEVLLNTQNLSSVLPNSSSSNPDPARAAATQAGVARVPTVAANTVKAVAANLTVTQFLKESAVSASSDSDLLTFSVTNHDSGLAARLVNAYAHQYVAYRRQLDTLAFSRAAASIHTELARLRAAGESRSGLYRDLVGKSQQLATAEALQTSNALVVRTASSSSQVQPRPARDALFGGVLGLLLGVGIAFLREGFDTRVRSPGDLAARLRLPLLARLSKPPRGIAKKNSLVMLANPESTQAESFRVFATNLEFANMDRRAQTILFTSASEDEGKSTTVANLAVAFALAGRKVVLVDLDLRNPALHRFFSTEMQPGVTDVVLGRDSLEKALVIEKFSDPRLSRNGSGNLGFLPCGTAPPSVGEFIRSQQLAGLLAEARQQGDLVLIDSTPALGVGDAMAVSAYVDGLVLVLNLRSVREPVLDELHRVLATSPAPVLGVAVTGVENEVRYGYGSYAGANVGAILGDK
jgi:polysaccharide biosynthesis transport protein